MPERVIVVGAGRESLKEEQRFEGRPLTTKQFPA